MIFCAALGIRFSSVKSIRNVGINWARDGESVLVHVSEYKWLPEGKSRAIRIKCACNRAYTSLDGKDCPPVDECCLLHNKNLGLPRLPIDPVRYMERLRAAGLWGHSPRVTMATVIECARRKYNLLLKMSFVYYGLGWSMPPKKKDKKNKFAMFSRYSAQANTYKISDLAPLYGHAANLAGIYEDEEERLEEEGMELDSGCDDTEDYICERTGRMIRIQADMDPRVPDVDARVAHSVKEVMEAEPEGVKYEEYDAESGDDSDPGEFED